MIYALIEAISVPLNVNKKIFVFKVEFNKPYCIIELLKRKVDFGFMILTENNYKFLSDVISSKNDIYNIEPEEDVLIINNYWKSEFIVKFKCVNDIVYLDIVNTDEYWIFSFINIEKLKLNISDKEFSIINNIIESEEIYIETDDIKKFSSFKQLIMFVIKEYRKIIHDYKKGYLLEIMLNKISKCVENLKF